MIAGIVAFEKNHGIGFENTMPWPRLNDDMRWFAEKTKGNIVLMGSKTWKSLNNPLVDRVNVVISSQLQVNSEITLSDPVDAIKILKDRYSNKDIYVIGGQSIYDILMDFIEVFYITEIDASYKCDKFFNYKYVKENFKNVETIETISATDKTPSYTIKEYTK